MNISILLQLVIFYPFLLALVGSAYYFYSSLQHLLLKHPLKFLVTVLFPLCNIRNIH